MIVKPNWKWEGESVEILARGRDSVLVDVKTENNFPTTLPSFSYLFFFRILFFRLYACVWGGQAGGVVRFNILFYLSCLASIEISNLLLESNFQCI